MKKIVVFRFFLNKKIGYGHFYRCVNYSEILNHYGYQSIFYYSGFLATNLKIILNKKKIRYRKIPTNLNFKKFKSHHILNIWINKNLDWQYDSEKINFMVNKINCSKIIVDIPGITKKWITKIDKLTVKLVIDDIPVEKIKTNIVVNPNYSRIFKNYYSLNKLDNIFIGPNYIPFAKNILSKRKTIRKKLNKIVLYMGSNISLQNMVKIIEVLEEFNIRIKVVSIYHDKLQKKFKSRKISFHNITNKIFNFYIWGDLAIGCCGISAWERCYLNIPTINYVSAENQIIDADMLNKKGAIINLGSLDDFDRNILYKTIFKIKNSKFLLQNMSKSNSAIFSKNKMLIQNKPIYKLCMS